MHIALEIVIQKFSIDIDDDDSNSTIDFENSL